MKKGFKGFDKDMRCNNFQFKIGKTYEHDGEVKLCNSGFHYCENPIDILAYYSPNESIYAEIESENVSDETSNDSKRVCSKIKIGAKIDLSALITSAIQFVFDRADWSEKKQNATGDRGAASATGKEGCASALGIEGKAKGMIGCWLTLAEWKKKENCWHRVDVQTRIVDGKKIKADTFYKLEKGEFVVA